MIKVFEKQFIELYSENDLMNIKWITKSLLFTLIPLHDNEKCIYLNIFPIAIKYEDENNVVK